MRLRLLLFAIPILKRDQNNLISEIPHPLRWGALSGFILSPLFICLYVISWPNHGDKTFWHTLRGWSDSPAYAWDSRTNQVQGLRALSLLNRFVRRLDSDSIGRRIHTCARAGLWWKKTGLTNRRQWPFTFLVRSFVIFEGKAGSLGSKIGETSDRQRAEKNLPKKTDNFRTSCVYFS